MISETVDGYVGSYQFELTSSVTQTYFANAVNVLLNIANASTNQTSSADLTNYNNALNVLKDLAKGFVPGTTQHLDVAITSQMANSINALLTLTQSINSTYGATQIASINNSIGLNSVAELNSWKDLYISGAKPILTNAATHSDNTAITTLQSYLQTNYIETGNEILYNQLVNLQQAIKATQQALIVLGNVQSLKNRATVQAPTYSIASQWSAGLLPTKKIVIKNGVQVFTKFGVGSIASYYQSTTTSTIGSRLLINVDPSFAASIQSQGLQLVSQLQSSITELNRINPAGANDPNSLQSQLQTVVNNMTVGPPSANGSTQSASAIQADLSNNIGTMINILQGSSLSIKNQLIGPLQTAVNGLPQTALGTSASSLNQLITEVLLQAPLVTFSGGSGAALDSACRSALNNVTALNNQASTISWWVLDNYNDRNTTVNGTNFDKSAFNTGEAGNYQRNLTNAFTTAENLNDSQKASLQTSIFNFQEFYQSASAVLNMIQQFMQQMANQINH